jgi:hypothetical protein
MNERRQEGDGLVGGLRWHGQIAAVACKTHKDKAIEPLTHDRLASSTTTSQSFPNSEPNERSTVKFPC